MDRVPARSISAGTAASLCLLLLRQRRDICSFVLSPTRSTNETDSVSTMLPTVGLLAYCCVDRLLRELFGRNHSNPFIKTYAEIHFLAIAAKVLQEFCTRALSVRASAIFTL